MRSSDGRSNDARRISDGVSPGSPRLAWRFELPGERRPPISSHSRRHEEAEDEHRERREANVKQVVGGMRAHVVEDVMAELP